MGFSIGPNPKSIDLERKKNNLKTPPTTLFLVLNPDISTDSIFAYKAFFLKITRSRLIEL